MSARGLAALRKLAAPKPVVEHCALCAAQVPDEHPHLIDPQLNRLLCACTACAILFDVSEVSTRFRRVPRDVRELTGLEITDMFWNSLSIPIGLAFFVRRSVRGEVVALYPSPAGPTEFQIDEESWAELQSLHPALHTMRDDVEALLVNRIKPAREYYLVPIDECYKLTGLIRRHWRGFSGGDEAWQAIRTFFNELKQRHA